MKTVLLETLHEAAKGKPIGYLTECLRVGRQEGDAVVFEQEKYEQLVAKYSKYRASQADPYRSRISGCCDRADQY